MSISYRKFWEIVTPETENPAKKGLRPVENRTLLPVEFGFLQFWRVKYDKLPSETVCKGLPERR